jgi:sarcosine oxidase/L-pipecolate oxidase
MKSFANVQKLLLHGENDTSPTVSSGSTTQSAEGPARHAESQEEDAVSFLPSPVAIAAVTGTSGASGSVGYINHRSGWVDAEACMRWLRTQVEQTGRVSFVTGKVTRLLFSPDGRAVLGAVYSPHVSLSASTISKAKHDETADSTIITSSLTLLAAGAWSPTLLDLRARVHCTAQPLAYIALSPPEAALLARTPAQMNMSDGYFVIPPAPVDEHGPSEQKKLVYKVARHSHGFANPTRVAYPEPHRTGEKEFVVSVPSAAPWPFPGSTMGGLRGFLHEVLSPAHGALATRAFEYTRFCHYADTPTGDFLVDYVPRYGGSLVVATGGSGHAFKFLPVLGDAIVRCIAGERRELERKWVWKEDVEMKEDLEWGTLDGSRSGGIGLVLRDELGKG